MVLLKSIPMVMATPSSVIRPLANLLFSAEVSALPAVYFRIPAPSTVNRLR